MLYPIVTGIWTNWNDGSVVLTVGRENGPLLIAATALFVNLSVSQGWNILRFLLHQARSAHDPQSGLYHQIQSLLRNMPTSGSALWSLVRAAWAWRGKDVGAVRESAGPIFAAALHLCVLTAAGILSSRVVIAGDKVLVNGAQCGWSGNPTGSNDITNRLDADIVAYEVGRRLGANSQRYAQTCYNSTGTAEPGACNEGFFAQSINLTAEMVPCPFSKDLCALPGLGALQVDTGFIDSSEHLGINTRPDSRLRFRKVITYTPILAEEQLSSGVVHDPPLPEWFDSDDTFRYYYLGPSRSGQNYTLVVDNYTFWTSSDVYRLNSVTAWEGFYDNLTQSTFSPIPALRTTNNTDLTLLFLTNMAIYPVPVHDPWFRATSHVGPFGFNFTAANSKAQSSPWSNPWVAERAVSVLACTEQYQVCHTTHCDALSGMYPKVFQQNTTAADLNLDPVQTAILRLVYTAFGYITLNFGAGVLGSSLLLARNRLITLSGSRLSGPLPDTQWRNEAINIAATMLAALQQRIVDFASPPDFAVETVSRGTVRSRDYVQPPAPEGEAELCRSVRVVSRGGSYNFSMSGLAVILAVGLVIISVNLACIPGAAFWARRRLLRRGGGRDQRGEQEWYRSDLLVAQSILFEKYGVGSWVVDRYGGVPTLAEKGRRFDVGSGGDDAEEPRAPLPRG